MGNAEIAKRVNTSAATCHRRIQRLFAEGYVTGVRAQIAPKKVEMGTLAFVGVVLDRSTPESFGAFEEAIREMKLVLDCHIVAGDFDYILKIRVRDMADFNKLHADRLIALPGVRQTRTFFVMKEVVDNAPLVF
jgi:Lrp/AsnC family leucine-responsive transcriptional regulator